jgi:rRNA-processing protein FCF1
VTARYVAPDTNFIIHARPLNDVGALIGNPIWLFGKTVIRELDEKSHHQSTRIKNRARQMLQRIEKALETGDPVFHMDLKRRTDYACLDLDANDADDRIIGEVITFANEMAAVVELLTLDTGMRIRARSHNVALVFDPERFRVTDVEDPVEKRARAAEAELERVRNAEPVIVVEAPFSEDTLELAPPLTEAMIDEIIRDQIVPEADIPASIAMGFGREQPNYERQLTEYSIASGELCKSAELSEVC